MSASDDATPSVPGKPPEWYGENPHARSSFSRLATYRRCPAWYRYQYLGWHRSWAPAVTRAGQAVQEALERLIDSEPAAEVTRGDLEARAVARAGQVFARTWSTQERTHAEDPNSYGPWDLPRRRYEGYVERAVRLHLRELDARIESVHPRTREPLDLPPVTSLQDAWAAIRPIHAPPGTPPMETMEAVPAGYFQGQCDLVYEWTGGRRLVDLKASSGRSPFSTEIRVQLLAYSFLDRELGRGRPEGIEAWFLGQDEPTVFDVPGDDEIDAFDREVRGLIERSGHEKAFGSWKPADFPPEPAPVPGHSAAGGEPSAWCRFCPAALLCPRTPRRAPPVGQGARFDRIPEDAPQGGVTVEGLVLGVADPVEKADGRIKRRFTVANESGAQTMGWDADAVLKLVEQGLRAGRTIRLTALNPWRPPDGKPLLFPTPRTTLTVLDPVT